MPVTIAPINQYASDWSEAESTTENANTAADGTGLSLSSSNVWLADADTIASQSLTGDEILLSQIVPDQTPNLIDNTDVANTNVIAVGSSGINLGEDNTGSLFAATDPQIEQGSLTFSLNATGGTQSSSSGSTSFSTAGAGSSGAGLNNVSPLLGASQSTSSASGTTTIASGDIPLAQGSSSSSSGSTSSLGSTIEGSSLADISLTGGSPTSGSTATIDGGISRGASSSSTAVPIEFSPSIGLIFIVFAMLCKQHYKSIIYRPSIEI